MDVPLFDSSQRQSRLKMVKWVSSCLIASVPSGVAAIVPMTHMMVLGVRCLCACHRFLSRVRLVWFVLFVLFAVGCMCVRVILNRQPSLDGGSSTSALVRCLMGHGMRMRVVCLMTQTVASADVVTVTNDNAAAVGGKK